MTARTGTFRPGPVLSRRGTRMGRDLDGMGAPSPMPSQDRDRDGTKSWWDEMGRDGTGPGKHGAGLAWHWNMGPE